MTSRTALWMIVAGLTIAAVGQALLVLSLVVR